MLLVVGGTKGYKATAGGTSRDSSAMAAAMSSAVTLKRTAPSGMSALSGSSMSASWAGGEAGSMCSLVVRLAPLCMGMPLPANKLQA